MEITRSERGGIVILELQGRLDTTSSSPLEKVLLDLAQEKGHRILIDFSLLDFISSSGLRVLLATGKASRTAGGQLVLCGLKKHVKGVFDVAGFTMLFRIFPSRESAAEGLTSS